MAKYNGSNLEKIVPQFHNISRPALNDEQVNSWWDAMVSGVGGDKGIQQKIGDGQNLYFFNDEGDLVPALNKKANTADVNVRRQLMLQSINGRLFTRAFGKAVPRQIVTDANDSFSVGIANDEQPWRLPQPELPQRPEAPSFIKYLLYPFFRKEIQAYNRNQEAYDALLRQGQWIRGFDGQDEYLVQDQMVEREAPYREQQSHSKEEVAIQQPVRSKNIADMTPETFKAYLTEMGNHFGQNFRPQLRKNPNATANDYYDAVATQMECLIAKNMLSLGEGDPKYFSDNYRVTYQALANGLDEFVRTKLDKNLIDSYLKFGTDAPGLLELANNESHLLSAEGVNEYQLSIAPKNKSNEQQIQNDPPKNELENPNVQAPVNSMM